ncbi:MAG: M20 family metallopeptidase [bacterium]
MHQLVKEFVDQREEMINLLQKLVELESPSIDKEATDKLSSFLANYLQQLGCQVEILEQENYGNHVLATFGEEGPPLLVLCHMDTVWATGEIKERPFRVEGNKAYGPGVMDMKGGIVQALFALAAAKKRGLKRQIKILLNTEEEIGSPSSRPIIEEQALKAKAVLVLEPPVGTHGALKTFRKGVGMFNIKVKGKAAHAGADPEKGVSAVEELARQIIKLHSLTDLEQGTTVNVGVIGGGTRSNVIAAEAWAGVDLRVPSMAEVERVMPIIQNLKPELTGTEVVVEGELNRPPMERTPAIVQLFQHAQRLGEEMGFNLEEIGTGGASDGNFTAALGVPTLDGLGAVGEGGHAHHEYIILDYLPERAALLTRLFETL